MPSPYKGKEKVVFGENALIMRPLISAHIAEVANRWTLVEELWGIILADMLEGEGRAAMAIYLALLGTGSHRAVLQAVADLRLRDDTKSEMTRLLTEQRRRAEERNRIVHGRWGYLPGKDGVIVLGERNWLPQELSSMHHYYAASALKGVLPYEEKPMKQQLYRVQDFLDVEARIVVHHKEIRALHQRIFSARELPPS